MKKCRLREKCAIAGTTTTENMLDSPTKPSPTNSDNFAHPSEAIAQLWRLVARRAAKQAWQDDYVKEQRLIAACAPPLWDLWGDVRQAADNYYYKHLFRTAPIAVYAIVEPTAATNNPPTMQTDTATVPAWIENDDCDTVAKVEAKLLRMQEHWAESRTGPFPESVRNAIAHLRASFEKRDTETAPAPEPLDLAADVQHVSTTTSLVTPANTATSTTTTTTIPAIHETTTIPERVDQAPDVRHVTPIPARSEVELTTTTTATTKIGKQDNAEPREDREEKRQRRAEEQERRAEEREKAREREVQR